MPSSGFPYLQKLVTEAPKREGRGRLWFLRVLVKCSLEVVFGQLEEDYVFDIGLVQSVLHHCLWVGRVHIYRPSFKFGE